MLTLSEGFFFIGINLNISGIDVDWIKPPPKQG
jgi:hypothetical protein